MRESKGRHKEGASEETEWLQMGFVALEEPRRHLGSHLVALGSGDLLGSGCGASINLAEGGGSVGRRRSVVPSLPRAGCG